ncbi:hypothetical protein GCM10027296_05810 [Chitinimonas naiadis]
MPPNFLRISASSVGQSIWAMRNWVCTLPTGTAKVVTVAWLEAEQAVPLQQLDSVDSASWWGADP